MSSTSGNEVNFEVIETAEAGGMEICQDDLAYLSASGRFLGNGGLTNIPRTHLLQCILLERYDIPLHRPWRTWHFRI
jgi:hypothetical protein